MKMFALSFAVISSSLFAANNRDKATQTIEQCVVTKSSGKNDQRNVSTKVPCAPKSKDKANGGAKK